MRPIFAVSFPYRDMLEGGYRPARQNELRPTRYHRDAGIPKKYKHAAGAALVAGRHSYSCRRAPQFLCQQFTESQLLQLRLTHAISVIDLYGVCTSDVIIDGCEHLRYISIIIHFLMRNRNVNLSCFHPMASCI